MKKRTQPLSSLPGFQDDKQSPFLMNTCQRCADRLGNGLGVPSKSTNLFLLEVCELSVVFLTHNHLRIAGISIKKLRVKSPSSDHKAYILNLFIGFVCAGRMCCFLFIAEI